MNAKRIVSIVESAGAQWMGVMNETIVLFRDPVTGSSCSLPLTRISVPLVREKLEEKRKLFGGKS